MLQIVYECHDFIIVNKLAGQNGHPLKPEEQDTTLNAIIARYPECGKPFRKEHPLEGGLVHRLDRGTSGLLVCARTELGYEELTKCWKNQDVEKIYLACVEGVLSKPCYLTAFLSHDTHSKKRMRVSVTKKAKHSWLTKTLVFPIVQQQDRSFVLVQIKTGVTHQIRAVLATLGHSIVGDPIYKRPAGRKPVGRVIKRSLAHKEMHYFKSLQQQVGLLSQSFKLQPIGLQPVTNKEVFFLHAFYLRIPASRYTIFKKGIYVKPPWR